VVVLVVESLATSLTHILLLFSQVLALFSLVDSSQMVVVVYLDVEGWLLSAEIAGSIDWLPWVVGTGLLSRLDHFNHLLKFNYSLTVPRPYYRLKSLAAVTTIPPIIPQHAAKLSRAH
jgi:hypothetical protein